MYLIYNSVLSPEVDFGLRVDDRAFQYGDGLFETLRYQHGRIAFWPDHYDRLMRGMAALHLDQPAAFSSEILHTQLVDLLTRNGLTNTTARLKLQVWRQAGGLYTPTTCSANVLITAREGHPFWVTKKAQLGVFDSVRLSHSSVSAFKTANALPYVLAGLAKQRSNVDDMMLLDTGGHVAECIASALFWLRGETLFFPSLTTGCIDGILRRQLIGRAPELGFAVREGLFRPGELAQADAVFCGNVMGIQQFGEVSGLPYKALLTTRQQNQIDRFFGQLVS